MTKYPLAWPGGWKRIPDSERRNGHFGKKEYQAVSLIPGNGYYRKVDMTVSGGVKRVLEALRMMGVEEGDAIISTNLKVRLDGLPRSDQKMPDDPGVAVCWVKQGWQTHKVMATDQYTTVADNLAAIAATLEAMRAIERHGGSQILDRAFIGFEALPEPKDWRAVLGFQGQTPSLELAKDRYKDLAKRRHPDCGGSNELMAEFNRAMSNAERELNGG